MAKFAKGVNHVLPNVMGDTVVCKEGEEVPSSKIAWFKEHKPDWIEIRPKKDSKDKAIEEAPADKAIKPLSTKRK